MKTVNKLDLIYRKLVVKAQEQRNETVDITDEEYAKYYEEEYDYSKEYLTIENASESTNTLLICKWSSIASNVQTNEEDAPNITVYYSFDKITWNLLGTTSTGDNVGIFVNFDDKIYLKSNTNTWTNVLNTYNFNDGITGNISYEIGAGNNIVCTKQFIVYGNIMSLLYGDDFMNHNTFETGHTFSNLFDASQNYSSIDLQNNLLDASNLILPNATSPYCYRQMFMNCKKLINTPLLPATILSDACYLAMFYGCESLSEIPELPATSMKLCCYANMFGDCKGLTTIPNLPVETLAIRCYESMFQDCINLTTIKGLPAKTLEKCCYYDMFNGCSKLSYIKCLATDISASNCTLNWVTNVSSTGTFIKNSKTNFNICTSGIPAGWEVIDEEVPEE